MNRVRSIADSEIADTMLNGTTDNANHQSEDEEPALAEKKLSMEKL